MNNNLTTKLINKTFLIQDKIFSLKKVLGLDEEGDSEMIELSEVVEDAQPLTFSDQCEDGSNVARVRRPLICVEPGFKIRIFVMKMITIRQKLKSDSAEVVAHRIRCIDLIFILMGLVI